MMKSLDERAIILGRYILENRQTVRGAAEAFAISKSTVHKDVTQRLRMISPVLYRRVMRLLQYNKAQRHIRGGQATCRKYFLQRQKRG